jgi:hypothetical protein
MAVEHLGGAVERLGALGERRLVRFLDAEQQRLRHIFEGEHRAGRIPVREIPELPARHVEPSSLVLREQAALRFLRREILGDRIGFPQHVLAFLQGRHAHVGIERGVLRRPLVALGQVDHAHRVVEAEMVGDRHHLEGARAGRKHVKLDGHEILLPVARRSVDKDNSTQMTGQGGLVCCPSSVLCRLIMLRLPS